MKKTYILILCLGMFTFASFGHDQIVHEAITVNAAESAFDNSPAYYNFLNTVSADMPLSGPKSGTNLTRIGSFDEDFTSKLDPIGGNRSLNHFYDPTKNPPIGLTDTGWPFSPTPLGRDSFSSGIYEGKRGMENHLILKP